MLEQLLKLAISLPVNWYKVDYSNIELQYAVLVLVGIIVLCGANEQLACFGEHFFLPGFFVYYFSYTSTNIHCL